MKRARVLGACALALVASGCGRDDADTASSAGPVAAVSPEDRPADAPARAASGRLPVADDAEAAESFPVADPSSLTERAPSPSAAEPAPAVDAGSAEDEGYISPGAPSDAQIAAELKLMEKAQREAGTSAEAGVAGGAARLNPDGTASPPKGAPEAVRRIIAAANVIAKYPYVYGGGHGSFTDTAYDCSGSVSYALAAAGLVERTMVSGDFAKTGEEGPGKWLTIYANEGHMFMVVAGLRYDTSGRGGPLGSRWQDDPRPTKGFEVRHPPGL